MRCKQDEKSLQESEEWYKAIFDISLDGIFVITPDGTILAANPAACQMFGMTEEELIQAGRKKVVDVSDPRLKSLLEERDRTGRSKGELNHRRKDGTIFPCEISSAFFKDKDDLTKEVITIRDISERKQTEEILHTPEESYCSLLNNIDEGFCIIEIVEDEASRPLDFRFVETNPAFAVQSGVNGVVGKTIRQAFPQEPDEWIDIYGTVLNTGKSIRFERIFANQGRMLDLYAFRIEDETYRRVGVIFKDITKRKKAEEMLKTNLQRFYTILSNMHGAILLVSEDGLIEFANNIFCQYFNLSEQPADLVGITASEMIKKICNVYSDPDRAIAQIKEIIEMWEPVIGEEVELTGGRTCIRDFIPLSISGKTYGRLWYHIDITERKKTEKTLKKAHETLEEKVKERTADLQKAYESLKKSEKDLSEAQRIARLGNWEWDIVTDKMYWSEEIYRIFGCSPEEFDTTYMSFLSFIHPDDRNNVNNAVTETLSGKPYSIDYRVIQASGEERVVHAQGEASFGEDNNPVRLFGTVQDITDRKRNEETLRKSEKRYRLLHDNLRDAFAEVTIDGQVIDFNNQFYEILGYSSDEIRTLTYEDLTPEHWHAYEDKIIREQVIPRGYSEIYEKDYRRKDGTVFPVELRTVLSVDDAGQPISMWAIVRNITERKIAEENLRLSEEKYRSFIENFKGIAFQADENFIPIFLHGTIEEITGYRDEEFISKQPSWKEIVYPQDQHIIYEEEEKIKNSQNRTSGEIDYRIIRRDGKIKWVHEIYQKIPGNDENPDKYQGTIYDITKRKEAEETLAKIEITRKQEIHHRIKNNLQVISSLLDLQAEKFNGKKSIQHSEVLEAFKKSQDRVISMALIHEELHKGGEIDTLNFSRYIEELADNLLLTYRVGEEDISLNTDIEEDIFFNMDTAVPLGIIVNELVSNSLKHAFTTMDKGEIKIKLCREAGINANFILIVSDNGIGIPEDLDIEDLESLGLQLVTTLVYQLDGEFELKRNNGNEFIIRFTVTEKDNQASLPAPYY